MAAPTDDPGILLTAMGAYQDRQRLATGDLAQPTMVCADWAFHEERTGFDRDRIRQLLPQLVAAGLAQGLGTGMVWGYRAGDGYAWITEQGQRQLAAWRVPAPPYQARLDALGPLAADRLHHLLDRAATGDITPDDLDRLETRWRSAPPGTTPERDTELDRWLADAVLPFLGSILPSPEAPGHTGGEPW